MTRGQRLLVVAQAVRRAEELHQAAQARCERSRERLQQHRFAVYFSEQRLAQSWALLRRTPPCAEP